MREMVLTPPHGDAKLLVDRPELTVRRLGELGQTLISGDIGAAVASLSPRAPILGLDARAPAGPHALRIGRTSALLVTPAPLAAADGWRDGWCATPVDDGWAAVEVLGEGALHALMQAVSADLASGSPSAAVLVFGLRALLARTRAGFRVHIEATRLETLIAWLDGV
jgi:hypothetical protein